MKATVTIEIDTSTLQGMGDSYVAAMWHVAQANPADGFKSPEPGQLVEEIGREIIRRFCERTGPELWAHKGSNYDWAKWALTKPPAAKMQAALQSIGEDDPCGKWGRLAREALETGDGRAT